MNNYHITSVHYRCQFGKVERYWYWMQVATLR